MKKKILGCGLFFAGCLLLFAQELIRNGSFEKKPDEWVVKGKYKLDTVEKTEGEHSLLVTKKNGRGFDEMRQEVKVEPDTDYELTYYVKGQDLVQSNPQAKTFGVSISISGGGKRLSYGSAGLWKYDHGTFDWKKVTIRFNTKTFNNPDSLRISFQCPSANGTFRLDAVSLRKVGKKTFEVNLFPIRFLDRQPYTIAENLVGTIFLTSQKEKQVEYADGTPAVMTLDLPLFLRLAGATDRFIIKRQDKHSQVAYPVTEKKITRDGQPFRRYTISFDAPFIQQLGEGWYYQKIFLVPENGSAGKKGTIYWSFTIGKDSQKEASHPVVIHKPVLNTGAPCKRFLFDIGYSSVHTSPFPELRTIMTPFWKSLAVRPALGLKMGQGSDPEFTTTCYLNGDDPFVDMPHGRDAWYGYREKSPKDVKVKGLAIPTSPSWFKLEDPDKLYESYLRNSIRTALKLHPEIKVIRWDYEPERTGYDPEGRARFAQHLKLDHTPSIAEIGSKYRLQWRKYTLELNARFISKVAKIVKDEAPGCKFDVTSELLTNNNVSRWCDVDMRMIDRDPNIDQLTGMPYFCGAEFFDEANRNLSVIRKPLIFAQDPSERIWSYFSKYTPKRLYQNILATAALGGKGICHWPDDSMVAEYYQCLADVYGLIARYEDVYFDGKRVDREFTVTPQNTSPDYSDSLRMTTHEYRGKYYFTLFNYNEKDPVIVRIQGKDKDILAELPAAGAKVVEADSPGRAAGQ